MRTHGMSLTRTYKSWASAKSRCFNPNADGWRFYGGRGITMCVRWRSSFSAFYADMGTRPRRTSIDRINNDGSYTCGKCVECVAKGWLSNCRWATDEEQIANSSHPRRARPARAPSLERRSYRNSVNRRIRLGRYRAMWDEIGTLYSPFDEARIEYDIRTEIAKRLGFEPFVEIPKDLSADNWQDRPLFDDPTPGATLEKIGARFRFTRERARQIEAIALEKMRKRLISIEPSLRARRPVSACKVSARRAA